MGGACGDHETVGPRSENGLAVGRNGELTPGGDHGQVRGRLFVRPWETYAVGRTEPMRLVGTSVRLWDTGARDGRRSDP
jgi:hypothetical protein